MDDRIVTLELSADQQSPMGKVLNRAYYFSGPLKDLIELAPRRTGYPHNGGMHTLTMIGPRAELIAWVELLQEHSGVDQAEILQAIRRSNSGYIQAQAVAPTLYRSEYALQQEIMQMREKAANAEKNTWTTDPVQTPSQTKLEQGTIMSILDHQFRELIVIGSHNLLTEKEKAMVIRSREKSSKTHVPFLRVKVMNTPAGEQFGVHDIIPNGLSAGEYIPSFDTLGLLQHVTMRVQKHINSMADMAIRFNRTGHEIGELQIAIIEETAQPVNDNLDAELDKLFPGSEVITLPAV